MRDPNMFILTPQIFPPRVECNSWQNKDLDYFVDGFASKGIPDKKMHNIY